MRNEHPRRIIASLALGLTIALVGAACGRCGGPDGPGATGGSAAGHPHEPAEVSLALAARFAPDTAALVVLRDPAAVADAYSDFRPHVEAVLGGDLGMIETDLRNTLGIDLARPETLDASGIDPNAGAAIGAVGEQVVGVVLLSDRGRFEERITTTLQSRPFNLRAELERRRVGDANLLVYRRASDGPPDFAVALTRNVAYLIPNPGSDALDGLVGGLVGDRAESLAATPAYQASVAAADGYHVHAFVSASAVAAQQRTALSAAVAEVAAEGANSGAIIDDVAALGDLTLALRLTASSIDLHVVQAPSPEILAEFRETTGGEGDPGFAPLVVPDVYAFARLTIASDQLYAALRDLLGDTRRAELDSKVERLRARVGMDPVAELLPAFGSDVMLLFTRARLLTLSRAMNTGSVGEFFSGLGVVVAWEVRDRATVRRALEALVPSLDGRANLFEADGRVVVEFTDAQADIGNIVLSDRFLLLVPERQRQEVLAQLTGGTADLSWCDVEAARDLVRAGSGNGLFVDVRRVVEGPIGQVAFARLPNEVRRTLGRIDRVHTTTAAVGETIVTDIGLRFAAPAAAAP